MCLPLQYHTELVLCLNQSLHSHTHPTRLLKNVVSLSSVIKDVLSGKQDNSTLHLSLALEVLHGTSITCFFSLIFHCSFHLFPYLACTTSRYATLFTCPAVSTLVLLYRCRFLRSLYLFPILHFCAPNSSLSFKAKYYFLHETFHESSSSSMLT